MSNEVQFKEEAVGSHLLPSKAKKPWLDPGYELFSLSSKKRLHFTFVLINLIYHLFFFFFDKFNSYAVNKRSVERVTRLPHFSWNYISTKFKTQTFNWAAIVTR